MIELITITVAASTTACADQHLTGQPGDRARGPPQLSRISNNIRDAHSKLLRPKSNRCHRPVKLSWEEASSAL